MFNPEKEQYKTVVRDKCGEEHSELMNAEDLKNWNSHAEFLAVTEDK